MNQIHPPESRQQFTPLEKHLLNDFQHDFPLAEKPFADIADIFDTDEDTVLDTFQSLIERGIVSRIGPVFSPNRVGVSTLAAMKVPANELENIAAIVNSFVEVNHNYEREHEFNLWFVVTATDDQRLQDVLREIKKKCEHPVMNLPMEDDFFIDLGFDLKWT